MKIRIHREGWKILLNTFLILALLSWALISWLPAYSLYILIGASGLFMAVLQFFRYPRRNLLLASDDTIYAPADGKIVAIEETQEDEYFGDKRLQISIFMSPTNVHANWNPVSGTINYFKYHPGKYLVAWHPKSSTENERTTTVFDTGEVEILCRQIAGAVAKRIVNYLEEGDEVEQGKDMGFIKFGSRVDLYLPLNADIQVRLGQKVKGNKTVLALV